MIARNNTGCYKGKRPREPFQQRLFWPAVEDRAYEVDFMKHVYILSFVFLPLSALAQSVSAPVKLTVDWSHAIGVSRSASTLQVVVNPPLRPGDPLSAPAWNAVQDLGADYVRYVPWLPYPKLGVAELEPPTKEKTSWDFSRIDPMMADLMHSTAGHSTIVNFSTIPAWLFKTDKPVAYPANADQVDWHYTQGTELVDPSGTALGNYYARLVGWYVNGGFTDENGVWHTSGHHYALPWWEVLNEVDFEHAMTPQQYTARYDAIVSAIHRVSPGTKFVGLALAMPGQSPEYFEYFLNHSNHTPGVPLDMISYHFYASPGPGETLNDWQYTFFDQADGFLSTVRYIEAIRKRLSPETLTDCDELGVILPTDNTAADKTPPPAAYWNLAGALYAYLYIELSHLGIDVIGESQLVGYPTQFPSVSMMDWITHRPNARYWVLRLIHDSFHAGDRMMRTNLTGDADSAVAAQGFLTAQGQRMVLLLNKRDRAVTVQMNSPAPRTALAVDATSAESAARSLPLDGQKITLAPFAVAVLAW